MGINNHSNLAAAELKGGRRGKDFGPAGGGSEGVMSPSHFTWPRSLHQGGQLSALMNPIISFNHGAFGRTPPRRQACRGGGTHESTGGWIHTSAVRAAPLSAIKRRVALSPRCWSALITDAHA